MSTTYTRREDVPINARWALEDLYPHLQAWEDDLKLAQAELERLKTSRGNFGTSARRLADFLNDLQGFWKRLYRLYSYAARLHDQDARVPESQAFFSRAQSFSHQAEAGLAWIRPALLAQPVAKFERLRRAECLADYSFYLYNVVRRRAHIRNDAEEELIAQTGDMGSAPDNAYQALTTINLPFPEITLQNGERVVVNQAAYTRLRGQPDRQEREKVFQAFWQTFRQFRESLTALLAGALQRDHFRARARGYPNDLAASLDATDVPEAIYHRMLEEIRAGREVLWRYLRLKARVLKISDFAYSDLYVSLASQQEARVSFDQAQLILERACAPLGPDYLTDLRRAWDERWCDVYPTPGKRSGAYMDGSAYDVHPYVLLNYHDDPDGLSTLAHELGHALHSVLANRAQTFFNADYPTFTAEVASTVNENLLRSVLLREEDNPIRRLALLSGHFENVRTTVFRQALFADFELRLHQRVEAGEPITAEALEGLYLKLLREMYGQAEGVVRIDDRYGIEWAFVHHFYYNFYMFQYTTSFVAAEVITRRLLAGEPGARERYLEMLKAGGSRPPVELLAIAGVDINDSAPYREAWAEMNTGLDEVEKLVSV